MSQTWVLNFSNSVLVIVRKAPLLFDKSHSLYLMYHLRPFEHYPGPMKTSNDHVSPKYDQSYPNFSLKQNTHRWSLKQQLKMCHFPELKWQKRKRMWREFRIFFLRIMSRAEQHLQSLSADALVPYDMVSQDQTWAAINENMWLFQNKTNITYTWHCFLFLNFN